MPMFHRHNLCTSLWPQSNSVLYVLSFLRRPNCWNLYNKYKSQLLNIWQSNGIDSNILYYLVKSIKSRTNRMGPQHNLSGYCAVNFNSNFRKNAISFSLAAMLVFWLNMLLNVFSIDWFRKSTTSANHSKLASFPFAIKTVAFRELKW